MTKQNSIALRPSYWASVSGGKDSLYMLNLILHNLDRYPLDGVVHFELEIDYPFIHDVIDYMEEECKKHSIRFVRIKPRKRWEDFFYTKSKNGIKGYPSYGNRWCNKEYKLDAKKQLEEWMQSLGYYVVHYIGYCADEEHRFEKRDFQKSREVYPLVDFKVVEDDILKWAKDQPIFNNYYKTHKRCGCMYCPLATKLEIAYLYKYYPENYAYMIDKIKETENIISKNLGRPFTPISGGNVKYGADYLDRIIKTKWLKRLEDKEKESLC